MGQGMIKFTQTRLPALGRIPASDNDAGGEAVLVVVAHLTEVGGSRDDLGRLAVLCPVLLELGGHYVGDGLRVGGRALRGRWDKRTLEEAGKGASESRGQRAGR
eukprot:5003719-Prymnesium_polylepis.1